MSKTNVSIPSSSGQAFGRGGRRNHQLYVVSQSLLRQGKRSDCTSCRALTTRWSQSLLRQGKRSDLSTTPKPSSIGSQSLLRQGKRSDEGDVLVGTPHRVSIPSSSGQAFGQTGVENERIISKLHGAMCSRIAFHGASLRVRLFVC